MNLAFCLYPQGPQPMLFSKSKDPSLKLPVDKAVGTSREGTRPWAVDFHDKMLQGFVVSVVVV